jgi:hypothetical protein
MIKKIIICLIIMPLSLTAAGFSKVGTTAAPFLKIGVGARAVALGGNFVALANDATALYWNPAGIAILNKFSISATHTRWFADITHGALQLAVPLSGASAIGLDVVYLTSGDIEQTTLLEQDGNGIFYDVTNFSLGIAYAQILTDRFSVAIKGKYIREAIYNEEASTFAVDFGTIYKTGFKGLKIGMNLANFGGSMQMTGDDLAILREDPITGEEVQTNLKTETWPLPIIFRVGIALDIIGKEAGFMHNDQNRITLAIDGNHPNDNRETIGFGLEYEWNELLALRMGYRNNHDVEKFTFGGGFNLILGGINFKINYAYADYGDLDSIQRFTAGLAF